MNFTGTLDRAAFFAAIRPNFGGRLNEAQVAGMNAVLDVVAEVGMTDANHVANVLAEVRHETGGHMSPIKETVMPSHKDKNPDDATVIARLNKAYAAGKLPWVKAPYWRDGWFGRGPVQVTHRRNYQKVGDAIGVDLVGNPDLALDVRIGAMIAVIGMRDGLFRGSKLSDYVFPAALSAAGRLNPRRIINGIDGTDQDVAKYHRQFHAALEKAGWVAGFAPWPDHVRPSTGSHEAPRPTGPRPTTGSQMPTGPSTKHTAIFSGLIALVCVIVAKWTALVDALTFWN